MFIGGPETVLADIDEMCADFAMQEIFGGKQNVSSLDDPSFRAPIRRIRRHDAGEGHPFRRSSVCG